MSRHLNFGYFMVCLAAIFWGTIGFSQSFANPEIEVTWVASARFAVASLVFFFLWWVSKHNKRQEKSLLIKHWPMMLLAALSIVINNFCFFYGVRATGVAIGSVATIGSAPVWAGLLNLVFKGNIPSLKWWMGVLVATSGVLWVALEQASTWYLDLTGLMSCLLAGLGYALFTQVTGTLVNKISVPTTTVVVFSMAFVLATIFSFMISPVPAVVTCTDWLVFIYLGFFATGVAFFLYSKALTQIEASTGVALTLLDPFTSFLLAVFALHEPLNLTAFFGLGLILLGLGFVMNSALSPKEK